MIHQKKALPSCIVRYFVWVGIDLNVNDINYLNPSALNERRAVDIHVGKV